jgi:hypothetical protein
MKKTITILFVIVLLISGCDSKKSSTSDEPLVITLSAISNSTGSVTLTWRSSDSKNYDAAIIENDGASFKSVLIKMVPGGMAFGTTNSPYTVNGLISGKSYDFFVEIYGIKIIDSNLITIIVK